MCCYWWHTFGFVWAFYSVNVSVASTSRRSNWIVSLSHSVNRVVMFNDSFFVVCDFGFCFSWHFPSKFWRMNDDDDVKRMRRFSVTFCLSGWLWIIAISYDSNISIMRVFNVHRHRRRSCFVISPHFCFHSFDSWMCLDTTIIYTLCG